MKAIKSTLPLQKMAAMASQGQQKKKQRVRGEKWDSEAENYVIRRVWELRHDIFGDNGGAKEGSGERGKDITARAWDKIRDALEASGTVRTKEQVQKKFNNTRYSAMTKKAEEDSYRRGTGGGPASTVTYTPLEKYYLGIWGEQANLKGIGGRPDSSRTLASSVSSAVAVTSATSAVQTPAPPCLYPTVVVRANNPNAVGEPAPTFVMQATSAAQQNLHCLEGAATMQPLHAVEVVANADGILEHPDGTPYTWTELQASAELYVETEENTACMDLMAAEPYLQDTHASVPNEEVDVPLNSLPSMPDDHGPSSAAATSSVKGQTVPRTVSVNPATSVSITPSQTLALSLSVPPLTGPSVYSQSRKVTLNQMYKESLSWDIALKKQQVTNLKLEEELLLKQLGRGEAQREQEE